jgi:ParB family transcriptional regulator, chromosome partitioning protein
MAKRQALGRGLSALLDNSDAVLMTPVAPSTQGSIGNVAGPIAMLKINQIEANPFQPRTSFNNEALQELAASIESYGIIQPLTVRRISSNKFQLISGERRFRASQMAELDEIPAYIRVADDEEMLELALVENIQRENLDPIEIAISYKRLIEECELTQEQLSDKVGKSRSVVTNSLRLLKLPAEIQIGLIEKQISQGHARALVNAGNHDVQIDIFNQIVEQGLSVRQVEELVRNGAAPRKRARVIQALSFEDQKIQAELRLRFGKSAKIKRQIDGTGKIEMSFTNQNDLDQLVNLLNIE